VTNYDFKIIKWKFTQKLCIQISLSGILVKWLSSKRKGTKAPVFAFGYAEAGKAEEGT